MTKRQVINEAIKKWKKIRYEGGEDLEDKNCALCIKYKGEDDFKEKPCTACPVCKKTGQSYCQGTPYIAWSGHLMRKHKHIWGSDKAVIRPDCPVCKRLATREINFLRSLLNADK